MTQETNELLRNIKINFDLISEKDFFKYISELLKYINNKNLLKLVHYYYLSSQFDVEIIFRLLKIIKRANELEKEFYQKLIKDNYLGEDEKINLLITLSTIFIKLIKSNNYINDIDYINIENINKNNPYYQSINLITDIIKNLNEDSRLFEAFLSFNSGSIENYLEKNKEGTFYINNAFNEEIKITLEKYKTEYGINLLNVEQIKSHLTILRPN